VDVVKEIMEFYYKKGGRGLQVGSLPGGMEALHARKKHRAGILFYVVFISSLTCRWGEDPCHSHLH
jgi:hypothetical protein